MLLDQIHKKVLVDKDRRPVAVQIDYADWVEIESALNPLAAQAKVTDPMQFAGAVRLTENPLEYQIRIRGEWS
ncbi:MAG: hypothetical protein N3D11_16485 [Candidatus Sumerlaeia bacterium]|nr:hypothetical protein [Candidatus Sumerlaeia bacterium]